MWKPPVNFLSLHCTCIVCATFLLLTVYDRRMDHYPRHSESADHLPLWQPQCCRCLFLRCQRVNGIRAEYVSVTFCLPSICVWYIKQHYIKGGCQRVEDLPAGVHIPHSDPGKLGFYQHYRSRFSCEMV